MLNNPEIIDICIYIPKNVIYAKISKIGLHICYLDFMSRIYIIE